jgi:hypothetical protein
MPLIFSAHVTTKLISFNIDSQIPLTGAQHTVNGKNKIYQNDKKYAKGQAKNHKIKVHIIAYNIPGHAAAIFFSFIKFLKLNLKQKKNNIFKTKILTDHI